MKLEKITDMSDVPTRRLYEDACAAAHALDLIGERWSILVMRELILGPKRFSDLRHGLPGISANVLTQRLEGLEKAGIIRRRELPPPAPARVYELTAWGYECEPILAALGRWAARSPSHDPTLPMSATSLMLSLRTMFTAQSAGDVDCHIGFVIGAERYLAHVHQGELTIAAGPFAHADTTFIGNTDAISAAIYGAVPLDELEQGDLLRIEGRHDLARRFASWFALPPKIELQAP